MCGGKGHRGNLCAFLSTCCEHNTALRFYLNKKIMEVKNRHYLIRFISHKIYMTLSHKIYIRSTLIYVKCLEWCLASAVSSTFFIQSRYINTEPD